MPHAKPLTPVIGAEISGIDLRQPLSIDGVQWLTDQLVRYKVIFFRDQDIDPQQHLDFAREFGPLETHPVNPKDGFPELLVLHNDANRPPADTAVWHSDVTWRLEPSLGSILIARKVPEVGGDTLFANMEAAYQGLDDETKALITGRRAIHQFEPMRQYLLQSGADAEKMAKFEKKYPKTTHPIVRSHPITGEKSIYVNRLFTVGIEGMADAEAQPLLDKLFASASQPEYQCRFRWRKHSIAFWDNRAAQHYATTDYYPHERVMERATIEGDRPV
ncbi:MAG: TauD/TfdA family dioxygenase [Pseudomonadales bacterium]|nr:TauD/TfdA family dioxygenase [Pseudomonadales bacterium]